MGRETGISWTDSTWNPIRGCSRVSEGCRNCYAESRAHRFSGPGLAYEGLVQLDAEGKSTGKWNGQIKFVEEHLLDPLKWKPIFLTCEVCGVRRHQCLCEKFNHWPRRIFVNSMSDLFHENVADEMRDKIFAVMALCPQHTFQVLTKRPERMLAYLTAHRNGMTCKQNIAMAVMTISDMLATQAKSHTARIKLDHMDRCFPKGGGVFPNVHLGVSVENQKTADERVHQLRWTPAAVRFLSCEPLLGDIELDLEGIDWVIVGGESGHGARPMHPDWARSLRDQCKAAGVPFFFKQWGAWGPLENGETTLSGYDMDLTVHTFRDDSKPRSAWEDVFLTNAKTNGHLLDGVEHHEFPVVTQ
jgi:protein gp37